MKFTPTKGKIYSGTKYLTFLNHAFCFGQDVEFEHKWEDGVQSRVVLKNNKLSVGFPMPNGDERVYHFGKVQGSTSLDDEWQFYNIFPKIRGWWEQDWNSETTNNYTVNYDHSGTATAEESLWW